MQDEARLHESNKLYMNVDNHNYDSFNDLLKENNSPNESTEFETNLLSEIKN